MPFNPNEPQNGEVVDADLLRNQFNGLNDKIDGGEAAQFVAGDKAKLDQLAALIAPGVAGWRLVARNTEDHSLYLYEPGSGWLPLTGYSRLPDDTALRREDLPGPAGALVLTTATGFELAVMADLLSAAGNDGQVLTPTSHAPTLDAEYLRLDGTPQVMSLPTADPGLAGQLWNDNGTVKISAG